MMQTDVVTTALVRDGRLKLRNTERFARQIAKLRNGEYIARIERRRATRSEAQNRYLWGVCYELLSNYTGFTVDELHEWAKAKFLPKALAFADGNGVVVDEFVVGGSTTKLDKVQFGEFIEAIRRFAAEDLGVVIPDPDPEYGHGEAPAPADGH